MWAPRTTPDNDVHSSLKVRNYSVKRIVRTPWMWAMAIKQEDASCLHDAASPWLPVASFLWIPRTYDARSMSERWTHAVVKAWHSFLLCQEEGIVWAPGGIFSLGRGHQESKVKSCPSIFFGRLMSRSCWLRRFANRFVIFCVENLAISDLNCH